MRCAFTNGTRCSQADRTFSFIVGDIRRIEESRAGGVETIDSICGAKFDFLLVKAANDFWCEQASH